MSDRSAPIPEVSWRSPSNIALIKYWGKHGNQLPVNASLSMTLSRSVTQTTIRYSSSPAEEEISFDFLFQGEKNLVFEQKIRNYLQALSGEMPFLRQLHLEIESHNNFPHSAGIASSASSMSSLALCLVSIGQQMGILQEDFWQTASRVARLGSGSACRSVFPGWVLWGEVPGIENSSWQYAVPVETNIHPVFRHLQDSVLIVDSGKKKISSRAGHQKMQQHPFRSARISQAGHNMEILLKAMHSGDFEVFSGITENEALTLHALLMSAPQGNILLKPNTLPLIDKIQTLRRNTGIKMCFTLDAGPNIHLLYPLEEKNKVMPLIQEELLPLCEEGQVIDDAIGTGPERILNPVKV